MFYLVIFQMFSLYLILLFILLLFWNWLVFLCILNVIVLCSLLDNYSIWKLCRSHYTVCPLWVLVFLMLFCDFSFFLFSQGECSFWFSLTPRSCYGISGWNLPTLSSALYGSEDHESWCSSFFSWQIPSKRSCLQWMNYLFVLLSLALGL